MPASPSHRWLWLDIAAVVIASSLIGTWFLLNQPSTELRPKKAKAQQDEAVPKLVAEAIAAKQPNVVFIVLDTVRADHLSICDYDRPTSPNLAAFVASGAQLTCDAQAPATWTLPSHASFFTGVHPSEHHAHSITSGVKDWEGTSARSRRLKKKPRSLGQYMKAKGYQTRLLSSNPVVSAKLGLRRGFDKGRTAKDWGRLFGDDYHIALKKLMGTLEPNKPTLLFLNIADAHRPWSEVPDGIDWLPATPRTEHDGKTDPASPWRTYVEGRMPVEDTEPYLANVINNYDYAVWRADRVFGQVMAHLQDSGFCDRGCRFVITSDHGEMLGEHQLLDHGHYVWQSNIAVPLIYKDVEATAPLPSPIDAIYAFHLARDGKLPDSLEAPRSEGWPHIRRCARTEGKAFCDTSVSLRSNNEKLIWTTDGETTQEWLVDLSEDPDETNPMKLPTDHPQRSTLLQYAEAAMADGSDDNVDASTMEMLEALGYAE